LNQEQITEALKKVIYPGFEKDIVSFGFVKQVAVDGEKVAVRIDIPAPAKEISDKVYSDAMSELQKIGAKEINLDVKGPELKEEKPVKKNVAPQIKNFIMVSSGKGGVGKSTTSVNLAIALAMEGKKVGLLDADIYGPNIPRMMGIPKSEPEVVGNKIKPFSAHGVEVMSMGLIYEEGQSLIWRGPMIMRAIEQLLRDVLWSELDVLVIDMPPGTGDAQLTLAQSVPVGAGVTVTTPQKVSMDDTYRSLDMFKKLNIPIAGIIENMSGFICPETQKEYDIFGKGTTKPVAEEFGTKVIAQVPIEVTIREGGDEGKPVVFFHPNSISGKEYRKAAYEVMKFLDEVNAKNLADNEAIQPIKSDKSACSM